MRIAIDCRYVRIGRHDGISRFTAGLVEHLLPLLGTDDELVALIHDDRQLEMLPAGLSAHRVSSPTSAREPWVASQVNLIRPDVVFSPMQTMGTVGRRYPLALTLHDLIYYAHPTPPRDMPAPVRAGWRLFHLAWWPQRLLLNRADAVVTVSETSRALIETHRLTTRRVVVVPNGTDRPAPRPRKRPEGVELVYMGSFMPYKNVQTVCRALHELPGARLHLLSRIRPDDRARLVSIAPAGALVIYDGVSDEEYASILDGATALVHASREEGFGIPLVEAMGRGTPIVVADTTIFREIGGSAALYADPDDAAGFAQRVRELLHPGEWEARSRAGYAQAARFDWERSAGILLELLRELAATPPR
ncbi:glycosyltransferase family 1 protein [Microcella alkalica]|uniref:Glycosyltransferase involved in cell wall biosynthesis n=1 Tax=Microcella alkalica TaxID=355930 RepID=A0A839EAB2_9MICO|nr:glycosyltransferase family 1 protein [Microcella alkalica]MBA8847154.1 glycosyltransferase involved in cell wall biosynthesis [Microcella alkalica]